MLLIEIEANVAVVRFCPCLRKLSHWHEKRGGKVTGQRDEERRGEEGERHGIKENADKRVNG